MEKFMLLFRGSDVYQPDQSPEALQIIKQEMFAWLTGLSEKGLHVSSEPMEQEGRQVKGSSKTVLDSAYGSARDVVGGCTIVRAENIDEAVEIAKTCPILLTNANIEIRAIQRF